MRRVNELIKQEVGELVRREVNSSTSGLITVTDAEVAPDLRTAKIFYSAIGTPAQLEAVPSLLAKHRAWIQKQMAHSIVLKYTPVLHFFRDESLAYGDHISRLLQKLDLPQPLETDTPETPMEEPQEIPVKPSRNSSRRKSREL
jgi:ribosome-binding factor A